MCSHCERNRPGVYVVAAALPDGFNPIGETPEAGIEPEEEFPEFSLEDLTNGEIQADVDLSREKRCNGSLLIVAPDGNTYIQCLLPDLEWVHAVMNNHAGQDDKGNRWTWNEEGADLVE